MDADNELEGQLLQQFSSMGTTDKDVLIAEFQKLLGNQLSPSVCSFFLDMTNWNLQAAICAYYDFDQPDIRLPGMSFIKDVTIGEGEAIPPNTKFVKTWKIQNSGHDTWPPGCCLRYCNGENLSNTDRVMVEMLEPGHMTDVSVEMQSPSTPGLYQSQWRMATALGMFFGEVIWVIITVDEAGLLGVTQQLSQFGNTDFAHNAPQNAPNPFASPIKLDSNGTPNLFSPNSSMLAQHGSPYMSQLSPISHQGSPHPHRTGSGTATPARALFQAEGIFQENGDNTPSGSSSQTTVVHEAAEDMS